MRETWFIARTDLFRLLAQREVIVWTFVMPLVFFYFMSAVNQGVGRKAPGQDVLGVLAPADAGYLVGQLGARLEQRGFAPRVVTSEEELARYGRRLRIPAGFTASIEAKKAVTLEYQRAASGIGGDYDEVRIRRAAWQLLADCGLQFLAGERIDDAALRAELGKPRLLTVRAQAAGKRRDPPSGAEQAVPGTMVMFVLLVSFTTGAISLVIQRRTGTLRRLAFSPMPRGSIVAGKWAARWLLTAVQIVYAMTVGTLLFHVRWGEQLAAVVAVLLSYAALAASLGVLLGNFARNEKQVIGIGVVASNLMAALGGCWWPIEVTPRWAQSIAVLMPTGWAMDAMHKLISFEMPASAVLPHIAAMLAVAVLSGWVIARRFRFD
ncbi:MAG: ABC transporter permease [Bryobacterales bacterium]|nr:ABC transporter permease [Bryobacterales bacterium]